MIYIYGIKNCDTMKKALKWLDNHHVDYQFHDYKKNGLTKEKALEWVTELGWENILNRRGTTWRKLPDDTKNSMNEKAAVEIMLENPSIIKRPLLDIGHKRVLGFNEESYQSLFN